MLSRWFFIHLGFKLSFAIFRISSYMFQLALMTALVVVSFVVTRFQAIVLHCSSWVHRWKTLFMATCDPRSFETKAKLILHINVLRGLWSAKTTLLSLNHFALTHRKDCYNCVHFCTWNCASKMAKAYAKCQERLDRFRETSYRWNSSHLANFDPCIIDTHQFE